MLTRTKKRYREHRTRLRLLMEGRELRAPQVAEVLGVTPQYIRLAMCGRRALSASQLDRVQKHFSTGRHYERSTSAVGNAR